MLFFVAQFTLQSNKLRVVAYSVLDLFLLDSAFSVCRVVLLEKYTDQKRNRKLIA